YLVALDPPLRIVFSEVDKGHEREREGMFPLHTVRKEPYTALVGAIIGQKITYKRAKTLRGELYRRFGPELSPDLMQASDLTFLGEGPAAATIKAVTRHILEKGVDLQTEAGIRSLSAVKGIGPWTIETTLLTALMNWDLFP